MTEPTPPKPAPSTAWLVVRALLIIVGAFAAVAVVAVAVALLSPPPPPVVAPAPTTNPNAPLTGIATWLLRNGGVRLCVRNTLHRCSVRVGRDIGISEETYAWPPLDVQPVRSCDDQQEEANAACADAGGVLDDAYWACMASRGVFWPSLWRRVDPRDEHLRVRPDTVRIECAEGQSTRSGEN